MRKLQEELSVTPPDPLELKEAKQWAAIQEVEKSKRQREEVNNWYSWLNRHVDNPRNINNLHV